VARGDERGGSDLDLMVVGNVAFAEVVEALSTAQDALRREVNPNVYPPKEFAARLAAGEPFLRRVMAGPKVFVFGNDDDLGQPAAHRQAESARGDQDRGRPTPRRRGAVTGGRKRRRA
jgi:hypothetical protein